MDEQVQWLDGHAKKQNNVEKICPKRHIRQNQWQSEWNQAYDGEWSYDYISDYDCIFVHPIDAYYDLYSRPHFYGERWKNLQKAKQQGTQVSITNLAHFTDYSYPIIKTGGFKGRMKKINEDAQGDDIIAKFSWWNLICTENDKAQVRKTLGAAIQPFIDHNDDEDVDIDDDQDVDIDDDQDDNQDDDQDDDQDDGLDDGLDDDQDDDQDDNQDDDQDDGLDDDLDDDQNDDLDDDQDVDQDDNQDDDQDDEQDALLIELQNQFATSNPFVPASWRYGTSYFQYGINELCEYYGNQFDRDGELQFKILGTFGYKQEVMHAVLVCSEENGAGRFRAYPSVLTPEEDVNNEAVVTRDDDGNWIWKPQATATVIRRLASEAWQKYPKYRRWEHVAFAFHIPENEDFMAIDNLSDNLH